MSPEGPNLQEAFAPRAQIRFLCEVAREEFDLASDANLVRRDLDKALSLATPVDGEIITNADSYRRIMSLGDIAETAHATGQPAEYVQAALNKAVSAFEAGSTSPSAPNLDASALHNILKIARDTGQEPLYIESIFEHVREHVMDKLDTKADPAWRLSNLIRDAQRYGLAKDYVLELFEEGRARIQDLSDNQDQIARLAVVATLASEIQDDAEYTQDILNEAQDVVEEQITDAGMQALHFTHLAEVAQKIGQPEDYVQELLRSGLRKGFVALAETADARGANSLRGVVRMCAELEQMELGEVFIRRGVSYINHNVAATPRQKHQLLNGLVWGAGLPEDFTANGLISKRPFNYAFNEAA